MSRWCGCTKKAPAIVFKVLREARTLGRGNSLYRILELERIAYLNLMYSLERTEMMRQAAEMSAHFVKASDLSAAVEHWSMGFTFMTFYYGFNVALNFKSGPLPHTIKRTILDFLRQEL